MASELDSIAHPDPEAIHSPPARKRPPRRRIRWLAVIALALTVMQLMPNLGLLSPIVSPLVYSHLAPPEWHNATPHGQIALSDFAASTDEPGLMVACGSLFTLAWPEPWLFGRMRFWRSTDGGAHWQMFQPPFEAAQNCNLAIPPGGQGVVLATVSSDGANAPATLWVSHDAGISWQQVVTAPAGDAALSLQAGIKFVIYRHGMLYGNADFGSIDGGLAFDESANDGATWHALEQSPDRLERQGWTVMATAPDYHSARWWYRDLARDGAAPVLEHSTDDGATWTIVGPIGTEELLGYPVLATTPLAPDHLCVGLLSGETSSMRMLSSADDGRTWRGGTMPSALRNVHGETSLNTAIGATGDCYEGFHYGIGQEPQEGNTYYGFLRLASGSSALSYIPLTDDGNSLALTVTYVPADKGMPSRLVVELEGTYPGWARVFSGLAAETTSGQIVWRAVP